MTAPANRPVHAWAVWCVTATGPVVWMVHLAGASALVPLQCRVGSTWMVNALTAVCGVVIAASVVLAHAIRRRAHAAGDDTMAFLALVGMAWGVISLVVTVVEGLPNTVLQSCPR